MSPPVADVAQIGGKSILLQRIDKSYGSTSVLRGFDLTIPAGRFCTLLGASGSGKTTLLKLIAGFEKPDGGSIEIDGRKMDGVPVARRNMGMVFQNYALFPHMRVRANVAFGLDMRRVPRAESEARVQECLALVGLAEHADRHPRELSGGQQQRVALARALVIRPDILLMDEPLGALDKNLRRSLQLELKQLQSRLGVTVVFVTHDQEEALHMSDMIVLLNQGRIEQAGSPRDLYHHPASRFAATFLGECNCRGTGPEMHGVRPEKLRLGAAASGAEHRVQGEITDITFLGNGLRVTLQSQGEALVALTPSDAANLAFQVGQTVMAGYDTADAMPFSA
jgi:putative spermidine/putrescine transport system ATP-binding protein